MKITELKKANVGYSNTPLELMENLTAKMGKGNLYIKRDDLTGLALGGNKTRKLSYLIQHAKDTGCTAIMTFGGVQTNHGRLTVAAAVQNGLKPILVLKGEKPDYMSANLLLDRLMGADIYFVDYTSLKDLVDEERVAKESEFLQDCTDKIIAKYEAQGDKVLSVPVGGTNIIGAVGYAMVVPEIMEQMKAQNINAKYLVCGYGSTGTFMGLWAGAKYFNAPFEVIGIPIDPEPRTLAETAGKINELSNLFEMGITCKEEDLRVELGPDEMPYGGVGYNVPDKNTQKYIELMAKTEAIFVDPCYTGKVTYGFIDLIEKGIIPDGEDVILLHTGGSPGLFGKDQLDAMQDTFWKENGDKEDSVTVMKL